MEIKLTVNLFLYGHNQNQNMLKIVCLILFSIVIQLNADECNPSITTASGFKAPKTICSGQLIFDENFNELDKKIWTPEVTLSGNGVSLAKNLENETLEFHSLIFFIIY